MSVGSDPARVARQMPTRSRGCASKLTRRDSTANNANRLARSSRPKRVPNLAARASASLTTLAAATTSLSMPENESAVDASETGVELQYVIEPGDGPRLQQEAGGRAIRGHVQPRRAGQPSLLQRQDTENGFDDARRAKRVAQHSFRAAGWRTSLAKHRAQGGGFHRVIVGRAGPVRVHIINLRRLQLSHFQRGADGF